MKPCLKTSRLALILLALLPAVDAGAQDNSFTLSADYFTRGEVRRGGLAVSEPAEDEYFARFVLGRTRLVADFRHSWLSARLSAQHAGTWGSGEASNLSMNEAWVEMRSGKGFFVKVGRQPLSYDDQRIFGADDWSMTGLSHDVLKIGFEGGAHKMHLFGAYNQNIVNMALGGTRYTGDLQPYKSLAGAWYHVDIPSFPLGASLLFVNMGQQSLSEEEGADITYFQQLAGGFLSFRPEKWSLEAAYYHQWGMAQVGLPLDAWMASAKATVSPSEMWSFRTGYDYLSGEEDFATPPQGQIGLTRHDKVRGFTSLYGSNHKFYGAMDFFYVSTYVYGFTPGLQNLYAAATWTPAPGKVALDAAYHFLATAAPVAEADRTLGHEIEVSAFWSLGRNVSLSAGYTLMQGTKTMSILKRSSDNNRLHWGWLMLQVTPEFFSVKR